MLETSGYRLKLSTLPLLVTNTSNARSIIVITDCKIKKKASSYD